MRAHLMVILGAACRIHPAGRDLQAQPGLSSLQARRGQGLRLRARDIAHCGRRRLARGLIFRRVSLFATVDVIGRKCIGHLKTVEVR